MKLQMFTVHDAAAEAFLPPFCVRSTAEAVRMMADSCADPGHLFAKHPADYRLYWVGEFDDALGRVEALEVLELVCGAQECMPGPLFRDVANDLGRAAE